MKTYAVLFFLMVLGLGIARADEPLPGRPGRYQLYSNPHANRIYVLDTQSGRMFQLLNFKGINQEMLEEIPYSYIGTDLCTPVEYESSPTKCFNRNWEYLRTRIEAARQNKDETLPPPPPSEK